MVVLLQPGVLVSAQRQVARLDEVTFTGEEIQAAARLRGLKRSINPKYLPENVARLFAMASRHPLHAVTTAVTLRNARIDWTAIVHEYHRLIYDSGDALAPIRAGPFDSSRRSQRVRALCHEQLAALPPSVLRIYRRRVDHLAAKLLRGGKKARDARLLQRLVDELFCSRHTDEALDILGDLAFERGEFDEARERWSMLATPVRERPARLTYPDPRVDIACVRGKHILARFFAGDEVGARRDLAAFARLHPNASGHLAGKQGNYVKILEQVTTSAVDRQIFAPWPTFAGGYQRNAIAPFPLATSIWSHGPLWSVALQPDKRRSKSRQTPYHPAIVEQTVVIASEHAVKLFDLKGGKLLAKYQLLQKKDAVAKAMGQFTVSVVDDRIYACLDDAENRNALVCLQIAKAKGKIRLEERWRASPPERRNESVRFAGAPIIHQSHAYIAATHNETGATRTTIACFDADQGRLRWWKNACNTPSLDPSKPHLRHLLLTLAGTKLVYCTHSGAIVAVDCQTGKTCWAIRYPSRGFHDPRRCCSPRPCVYHDGRIYAAPHDARRVYCLDAQTGAVLWERDGVDVVHLLGVSRGRLFLTTATGLRGIDATNGLDWTGWKQPVFGALGSAGQGLLVGGWVLWPTRDRNLPVRAISQLDGSQELHGTLAEQPPRIFDPTQLRQLRAGNFAAGRHGLVVADRSRLYGYLPLALPKHQRPHERGAQ